MAKKKEALSRLEIDLGRLEEGKVKLSEQKGESPTVQEVVGRVEQGLGDVREETSRFIILSTQEGRRAFDEKRYEEAKQSFNKAIALEPFHHTKAYLEDLLKQVRSGKRVTDSTTTEEIVTTLESRIETAKKVEEALGDAKEYWLKTDEKLKKFGLSVGVITADKTTLAQADHFLAVAIGSLGVLRDEQLKKLGVESVEEGYWHLQPGQIAPDALKRAEAFQELVNKLFELRVRLSETKTGEDLSPLLLEAEKQLDSAYRSVNKFSLRVTGLNLALSFFRAKIGGFGLIPIFNFSIPDSKAPIKTQLKELTLGADEVRMAAESRAYERSLEKESRQLVNALLVEFSEEKETAQRLFTVEQELRATQNILVERSAEVRAGRALLDALKTSPFPIVVPKEKAGESAEAAKEEKERTREALQAVTRAIQHADSSYVINARDIARRERQIADDNAAVDSSAASLDTLGLDLYHRVAATLEAYEQMARAEKGYKETGRWHVNTPFHLLAHPKELLDLKTIGQLGIAFFIGREEIPGGKGAMETVITPWAYPDHPLTSLASGLFSVSSPDRELTVGAGAASLPAYKEQLKDYEAGLRKEKPTYPAGLGLNFKFGGEDKKLLAKKYLTSKEVAYIIARVMTNAYAKELLGGVETLTRRQTDLFKAEEDLSRRKEEQKQLGDFITTLRADSTKAAQRLTAERDSVTHKGPPSGFVPAEKGILTPSKAPSKPEIVKTTPLDFYNDFIRKTLWGGLVFLTLFLFKQLISEYVVRLRLNLKKPVMRGKQIAQRKKVEEQDKKYASDGGRRTGLNNLQRVMNPDDYSTIIASLEKFSLEDRVKILDKTYDLLVSIKKKEFSVDTWDERAESSLIVGIILLLSTATGAISGWIYSPGFIESFIKWMSPFEGLPIHSSELEKLFGRALTAIFGGFLSFLISYYVNIPLSMILTHSRYLKKKNLEFDRELSKRISYFITTLSQVSSNADVLVQKINSNTLELLEYSTPLVSRLSRDGVESIHNLSILLDYPGSLDFLKDVVRDAEVFIGKGGDFGEFIRLVSVFDPDKYILSKLIGNIRTTVPSVTSRLTFLRTMVGVWISKPQTVREYSRRAYPVFGKGIELPELFGIVAEFSNDGKKLEKAISYLIDFPILPRITLERFINRVSWEGLISFPKVQLDQILLDTELERLRLELEKRKLYLQHTPEIIDAVIGYEESTSSPADPMMRGDAIWGKGRNPEYTRLQDEMYQVETRIARLTKEGFETAPDGGATQIREKKADEFAQDGGNRIVQGFKGAFQKTLGLPEATAHNRTLSDLEQRALDEIMRLHRISSLGELVERISTEGREKIFNFQILKRVEEKTVDSLKKSYEVPLIRDLARKMSTEELHREIARLQPDYDQGKMTEKIMRAYGVSSTEKLINALAREEASRVVNIPILKDYLRQADYWFSLDEGAYFTGSLNKFVDDLDKDPVTDTIVPALIID
ncbi:MAG: hypothetical protein HY619_02605, partial [Thaumarchaeota archaeon]|nr:hypothetical protein [Nitrososphaerota archaeon]